MSLPLKDSLRRDMGERLRALSAQERDRQSRLIASALAHEVSLDSPSLVAAYLPLPSEPDPRHWLLPSGASWALSRVVYPDQLRFHDVGASLPDRPPGALGVGEADPDQDLEVPAEALTLVLVPGLAFDPATGHRLGRGRGCYDRFLASLPPHTPRVGLAFDVQLLPKIPHEPHDVPLDAIASPSGLQWIQRQ
ncbi:MAG: 5-formyltetrahydrofolate cyclo-ligase [Verrucomicrobiota bacterium]